MQWSPQVGETVAVAVAGLGLALATLLVDPVGRVLVGAAAVLLLALAARDALLRPRLRADADGVLLVLGRRDLGVDPATVVEALQDAGAAS
ncbi:hypothetical protein [Modestobacter lacusdianchii]